MIRPTAIRHGARWRTAPGVIPLRRAQPSITECMFIPRAPFARPPGCEGRGKRRPGRSPSRQAAAGGRAATPDTRGCLADPSASASMNSKRSSSQTGLPSAAARCATAVSTEITRSRLATSAAVSAKSSISFMKSVSGKPAGAAGPPFCRLKHCTSDNSNSGANRLGSSERRRSTAARAREWLRGLPAQARPTRSPRPASPARRLCQAAICAASAFR